MLDKLLILLFVCYLGKINNILAHMYKLLLCVLFENVHYFVLQQLAGKFLSLALYLFTQLTLILSVLCR